MPRTILMALIVLAAAMALRASSAHAQEASSLQAAMAVEQAMVSAIAGAEKSVVAIARVRKELPDERATFEPRLDPFGRRPLALSAPQPTDADFVPTEFGAGVVIDGKGLILTAYHLLGESSEYYVTTPQRKVYRATVKAADPRSDMAVLAIDATDLTPITLGDASVLKKGQIVIALGNPYAIARDGQASAAWGIVANLARKTPPATDDANVSNQPTLHHFGTLIQTDAKLNLGASGGPLVNLKGQMVGLSVALAAMSGYESAAGYAIPVDKTFLRVLDTLKQGREVEYGFLGIQPVNLKPREILGRMQGVRVDRVVAGTPAAIQGVKPDDIVTHIDGAAIHDSDGLMIEMCKLPVDAVAKVALLRGGKPRTFELTLTKYPVRGKRIFTEPAPAWRGMRVDYSTVEVSDAPRPQTGLSFSGEGVIVTEVVEGSAAALAGIRKGTLVTHVEGQPVRKPKDFHAAVAGHSGEVSLRLAPPDNKTVRIFGQ